jgi:hypothetical protein
MVDEGGISMKHHCVTLGAALVLAAAPLQGVTAQDAFDDPAIERPAQLVLRRACEYLESLERFSFDIEASYDEVLEAGYKLQYSRAGRVLVERPDRFRVESESDEGYRTIWYDGESLTILDEDLNVYARFEAPDTIDATLDTIADRGIVLPLDDLLYSAPCAGLGEHVQSGYYVGLDYADGGYRHHVLLATDAVDVQLWVEDSETPLIRKVVIVYGEEPGEPQFMALLRNWDVAPALASGTFVFTPPAGAQEIEILAAGSAEGGAVR